MATLIYASLETLKNSLNPDLGVDNDIQLTKALNGASRAIDKVTGRRFWIDDAVSARKLRPSGRVAQLDNGEQLLIVPDIATDTGLIVETGSGSSWTAVTGFELHPEDALVEGEPITGFILATSYWPRVPGERVRITAKWGWPAVPADIEQACLILARRLFHRKDSWSGTSGAQEWAVRLARKDPDVQELLEHFQLPGFG